MPNSGYKKLWWLQDPERALLEIESLKNLEAENNWLSGVRGFAVDGSDLVVGFDICHGDGVFPLQIHYPIFFPDVPSRITHREGKNISIHQYGDIGELCLRYRAETWDSNVTGDIMVSDAYRLISGEQGDDGSKKPVPSGDFLSLGQRLKSSEIRFVLPPITETVLASLPENEALAAPMLIQLIDSAITVRPHKIGKLSEYKWTNPQPRFSGEHSKEGAVLRIQKGKVDFDESNDEVQKQMYSLGLESLCAKLEGNERPFILLTGFGSDWQARYFHCSEDKFKSFRLDLINDPIAQNRLSGHLQDLKEKSVAIIGCGSIGSKVAKMLARSGVKKFLLADDDIFLGENMVRNELDSAAIGHHKVNALKTNIERLGSDFEIDVNRIGLGRQNAAFSVNLFLEKLSSYDLIVDATANARAFNYLSAVSTRSNIPLVFASVFAGGIGGLILRCRPDLDPAPRSARMQIDLWRESHSSDWKGDTFEDEPYGILKNDQAFIAGDAEVTIVAGHAARFVLDILGSNTISEFPYSAYAIGFTDEWVFKAPFHTVPIDLTICGDWGEKFDSKNATALGKLTNWFLPIDQSK